MEHYRQTVPLELRQFMSPEAAFVDEVDDVVDVVDGTVVVDVDGTIIVVDGLVTAWRQTRLKLRANPFRQTEQRLRVLLKFWQLAIRV